MLKEANTPPELAAERNETASLGLPENFSSNWFQPPQAPSKSLPEWKPELLVSRFLT
jgi:antibiotic biosynthesis monooxygenase (ABM) superfamily enzyme